MTLASGWGPALKFSFKILKKTLIYDLAYIQLYITDHMQLSP